MSFFCGVNACCMRMDEFLALSFLGCLLLHFASLCLFLAAAASAGPASTPSVAGAATPAGASAAATQVSGSLTEAPSTAASGSAVAAGDGGGGDTDPTDAAAPAAPTKPKRKRQKKKNKCWNCKKKVGVMGFPCKCEYIFCTHCRLPEQVRLLSSLRRALETWRNRLFLSCCSLPPPPPSVRLNSPLQHDCDFDHLTAERKLLEKANERVVGARMERV
jgi:hypothetical protein